MVMVEKKERRRVKAAGVQVILPEMFQRRVASPEACFGHVICMGRLPDVGTFRVMETRMATDAARMFVCICSRRFRYD